MYDARTMTAAPEQGTVASDVPADVRAIGPGWELFVDDYLLQRFDRAALRLHSPVPGDVVFAFDAPWEGPTSAYVTVFEHAGGYRMYYRGWWWVGDRSKQSTAVATSHDGITWERPTLGHVPSPRDSSRENNLVWAGDRSHIFTPFVDTSPAASDESRFKAISSRDAVPAASPRGLVTYESADGYHWQETTTEPVITDGRFDSQNLAFWDPFERHYVAYYRDVRVAEDGRRVRGIKRATSPDFACWSPGAWLDYGDAPEEQLYTNAVTLYPRANRLYLAFPKRYVPERDLHATDVFPDARLESGLNDGVFMSSRDGRRWDRRFMEAFLRPGRDPRNWTDRSNEIAWGLVQTGRDELSLYWGEHVHHPTCRLRRGTVRLDGFGSLSAGYGGGEAVTHPLRFTGGNLGINFATSATGSVRIELQEPDGTPIPGYTLDESPGVYGDSVAHRFRWREERSIAAVAGRPVRLRFVLRDADLYSFRIHAGQDR
jgi:hypothetical protein